MKFWSGQIKTDQRTAKYTTLTFRQILECLARNRRLDNENH